MTAASDDDLIRPDSAAPDATGSTPPNSTQPDSPEPRRTRIYAKSKDGELREISGRRQKSDDPEIEALWEMPVGEVEAIANDESHPLHAKAKTVIDESLRPIRAAIESVMPDTSALNEQLQAAIKKFWVPPLETSWLSSAIRNVPTVSSADDVVRASRPPLPPPVIDFESVEPPNATVEEFALAAEEKAQEIRLQQVELLSNLVQQARDDSEVAKGARRAAWWAVAGSFLAVVVTVAGIVVTVIVTN